MNTELTESVTAKAKSVYVPGGPVPSPSVMNVPSSVAKLQVQRVAERAGEAEPKRSRAAAK
jgi:hypothetical protein